MALPHSTDIFKYPARFQFGQAGAPCAGASCCTDTCIQMIVEYYKEEHYQLDAIRRYAQHDTSFDERPCTGITGPEVINALQRLDINHYQIKYGATIDDVWNKIDIGPVLVGVHYGSYPNEKGHCGGDNHAEVGGRTDCNFTGTHAVLAIGKRHHPALRDWHRDIFTRDPNHDSAARPERPDFDRIRKHDLRIAMENLAKFTPFRNTYIIHPTKKKNLNRL